MRNDVGSLPLLETLAKPSTSEEAELFAGIGELLRLRAGLHTGLERRKANEIDRRIRALVNDYRRLRDRNRRKRWGFLPRRRAGLPGLKRFSRSRRFAAGTGSKSAFRARPGQMEKRSGSEASISRTRLRPCTYSDTASMNALTCFIRTSVGLKDSLSGHLPSRTSLRT